MSLHDLSHAILNVLEIVPCSNNAVDFRAAMRQPFTHLSFLLKDQVNRIVEFAHHVLANRGFTSARPPSFEHLFSINKADVLLLCFPKAAVHRHLSLKQTLRPTKRYLPTRIVRRQTNHLTLSAQQAYQGPRR